MKFSPPVRLALLWAAPLAALCLGFSTPARADDEPEKSRYIRVRFDENDKPQALEVAVVRYVSADPTDRDTYVDLIGVVHIGDKPYYEILNKRFEEYDALLFELVAPKGTVIPKGGARKQGASLVSEIQLMMKNALALEFQLEQVDYTRKNFVHADMTPDEFSKSMENLKEDPMTMIMRIFQASFDAQAKRKRPPPNDLVLLAAMFDKKRGPPILKRIFAVELSEADTVLEALNGPQGSTLVTERNKVALKVLGEQLKKGRKHVGIFYGAAHMPDMEERLIKDFKMVRASEEWLQAWDLQPKAAAKPADKSSDKEPAAKE